MATHTIDWQQPPPPECRGGIATIGNYDGVHCGHRTLLLQVILQARAMQAPAAPVPAVVLTFDPHPAALLRPQMPLPRLTTVADRAAVLHDLGIDHVVVLRTTPDLLALEAAEFFAAVVVRGLQACALVEGDNFAFGRGRAGTIERLAHLCLTHGLGLTTVPRQDSGDEEISSSAVRLALQAGDPVKAAQLLGRPYRLRGTVSAGARRGRTLGFPTANLADIPTLIPRDGVYAVRAHAAGRVWPAAVNIGPNPTFGEDARKVEVHLIDFTGDLYGTSLAIDFVARLRDTRSFAGVPDLLAQLHQDVAAARTLAAVEGGPA